MTKGRIRQASYQQRITWHYDSNVHQRIFCDGNLVLRAVTHCRKKKAVDTFVSWWEESYEVVKMVHWEHIDWPTTKGDNWLTPEMSSILKGTLGRIGLDMGWVKNHGIDTYHSREMWWEHGPHFVNGKLAPLPWMEVQETCSCTKGFSFLKKRSLLGKQS